MARAINSLPVPVSPQIRTVESVGATVAHLIEQSLQRGTFADDLLKVVFGANFVFQVKLFLGELVFEIGDLLEGQGIFDGDGDLRGDLAQQVYVLLAERGIAQAGDVQRAQNTLARDQRDAATCAHAFGQKPAAQDRVAALEVGASKTLRRATGEGGTVRGVFESGGDVLAAPNRCPAAGRARWSRSFWVAESNKARLVYSCCMTRRKLAEIALKEFGEVERGDDGVVDLEQDAEAIAFACELLLVGLRRLKVEGVVHRHGHLPGDLLHELHLGGGVVIRFGRAEAEAAEAALGGGQRDDAERAQVFAAQDPRPARGTRFRFRCHRPRRAAGDTTAGVWPSGDSRPR